MVPDATFPHLTLVKNGGRYNLQPATVSNGLKMDSTTPTDSHGGMASRTRWATQMDARSLDRFNMRQEPAVPSALSRYSSAPAMTKRPYRDGAPDSPIILPGSAFGAEMEYLGISSGISPSASSSSPRLASDSVDKLRGKLLDLGSSFVGFDKVVEEDTMRRRQLEAERVQEVLDGLARLEKAVDVEIRRRMEVNKDVEENVQKLFSQRFDAMQSRILQKFEGLDESVRALSDRCCTLERGFQQLKGELPTKHQVETNHLVHAIKDLGDAFENDRRQAIDQDKSFLRQIQESGDSVDHKMTQDLEQLERRAEAIKAAIEEFDLEAEVPQLVGSRAKILEETDRVRALIIAEERQRERTDDDVVQAINEYTNALHRSLSIVAKTST